MNGDDNFITRELLNDIVTSVEELLSKDKSLAGTPYSFNGQAELKPLKFAESIRWGFEDIISEYVKEFRNAKNEFNNSERFNDSERKLRSITRSYNPRIIAIEKIIDLIKLYEGSSDGKYRYRKKSKSRRRKKSKKKAQNRKSKTKKF